MLLNYIKPKAVLLCVVITLISLPKHAKAAGAYIVDDAGVARKDTLQIENWFSQSNAGEKQYITNPAYLISSNLEFSMQETYDDRAKDINTLWPQLKYNFYEKDGAALTVVGGLNYATNTKFGARGMYFYVPASFVLNDFVTLNLNLGLQHWHKFSNQTYVIGGVNFEFSLTKKLKLVTEVFRNGKRARMAVSSTISTTIANGYQIGGRYFFSEDLIVDLIYGNNIINNSNTWMTFGLTVLF